MKLLQDNKKLHAEEFSNASPYIIMFGPDKCGATNKVSSFRKNIQLTFIDSPSRFTLSSGTRTQRLANMRRSTSSHHRWLVSSKPHRYIL